MGFLIDTCIWIDVERGRLAPGDVAAVTGDEPVFLSPIVIAELAYGVEMAEDEAIRHQRAAALDRLRRKPCLPVDDLTGATFGRLAAALKTQGRAASFRVQDIWLAAQAIQHDLQLLTRNSRDFSDVPGLQLVEIR